MCSQQRRRRQQRKRPSPEPSSRGREDGRGGRDRVKQLSEVPGPQSWAGNLSGRSLLLQPGHFKQRWRQTARGCTAGSEPPWSRRCADLRRRQVS
ncbi:hypothetical protein Celaphus_00011305 [Cervus elaphus hippelaphus]|uniref:Uncharacterized protein n=1 Tax=Cervus elaphus hippelaphus TaxID=46360 RepID=A0A212DFV8_CEREH|nr:hypothetical protein Celaphus_00011305 [Cervus elaphus hippelaphus]